MIIFRELPASLYRRFDKPNAVSIAHMKHNKAATITSGIDARNPPTLPVCKAETHCYVHAEQRLEDNTRNKGLYAQNWSKVQLIRIYL